MRVVRKPSPASLRRKAPSRISCGISFQGLALTPNFVPARSTPTSQLPNCSTSHRLSLFPATYLHAPGRRQQAVENACHCTQGQKPAVSRHIRRHASSPASSRAVITFFLQCNMVGSDRPAWTEQWQFPQPRRSRSLVVFGHSTGRLSREQQRPTYSGTRPHHFAGGRSIWFWEVYFHCLCL